MIDKLIVFIFGSIVGSFLNVCIYRLPKGRSVIIPGSHCPACGAKIHWFDNVPILSYILLRGRSRCCRSKISRRYFIVEVLTASLFTALYIFLGLNAKFFAYCIMASGLIVGTFVDFEIQEIPDEASAGLLVVGLIFSIVFPQVFDTASRWSSLLRSASGALVGGASIYVMGMLGELVFKKEAMGGGDVKLMAMIGSFIGWPLALFTFFLAPFFGSIVGIALKMKDGRETIPYGPYLSLAAIVAIFYGETILRTLLGGLY